MSFKKQVRIKMINISFPDGSVKQFESNITAYEVANAISMSLAKAAMVAEINGELKDLSTVIENDCKLRILTAKILNVLR